ncbi:MAG: hypothetical protein ABI432_09005 [Flavobacteriales bacterium]
MEVFDFTFDDTGDLFIKNGDLGYGESTLEHQRDLLIAVPGDIRQFPLIGVGLRMEMLNSVGPDEIRLAIQREMERDGMQVTKLEVVESEQITLNAAYA